MSRYVIDPYLFSVEEKTVLKALRTLNTPLKIHRKTNIPRPTVYFLLEKLKSRGLVKTDQVGKKNIWLLRKNEVDEQTEKSAGTREISTYKTKEEISDFFDTFFSGDHIKFQALNGDDNAAGWNKNIGSRKTIELNNLIRDNNLISDIISSEKFIKENKEALGDAWATSFKDKPTEYHLLDSKYTNFKSQIALKNGKVFLINMDKPLIFEIRDRDIYECFTSLFQFIKDNTKSQSLAELVSQIKKS